MPPKIITTIDVHIGDLICKVMKEKGIKKSDLARILSLERSTIGGLLKRKHIHPETLFRISLALDHDFFQYYSLALIIDKAET
jgi:plasmid maintenance system antidote protein VapI